MEEERWRAPQPLPVSTLPPIAKRVVKQPIRKIPLTGRIDLQNMDLMGDEALIKHAIDAGQFSGFRRLNARGEKWVPGGGAANQSTPWSKPGWRAKPMVKPSIALRPVLVPPVAPVKPPVPTTAMTLEVFERKALAAARLVPTSLHYHGGGRVWVIDAYEQFKAAYPNVTLAEFKQRLLEAHQAGAIQLARADTSGWGGEAMQVKDRASSIEFEMMGQILATYQIIVL